MPTRPTNRNVEPLEGVLEASLHYTSKRLSVRVKMQITVVGLMATGGIGAMIFQLVR